MTRSKSSAPKCQSKALQSLAPGRRAHAWLKVFAIPLLLGGCADAPRQSPYPAKTGPGQRVIGTDSEPTAPVRRPPARTIPEDTYAARLPELADSFSSSSIIQRLVEQQRKQAALRARTVLQPLQATPESGFAAETPEPAPVDAKAKRLKGRKARSAADKQEVAMAPAESPAAAQFAEPPAKAKGKRSGKAKDKAEPPKLAAKAPRKPTDQWETVRGNLVLASVEHEAIAAQLEHFRSHPGAVDFLMKRAEPYLQYMLEEINRQGLPADLVMVPMVESAFETSALSPKAAAGIWQFIPATGQRFGLPVSQEFDGRYDTHAATQAALKYLKHLNKLFNGDWLLALASYNAGEGAVSRAVEAAKRAGLEGSFWDLSLPAETEAYVVKIVALSRLVADPTAYGIKSRKAVALPFLTRVEASPDVKLADVMAASGTPPEEFFKLNPAYRPDVEPPATTHNFLLPPNRAEALQTANLPGTKVFAMRKVVVQKGETLSILAKRHGVPELKLAEWNGLSLKTRLKAGQEILVYPV